MRGWSSGSSRGRDGAGEEEKEKEKRKKRKERREKQGPKRREKDLSARWKGLFAKNRKRRRVAAKHRGWEKKRTRAGLGFA